MNALSSDPTDTVREYAPNATRRTAYTLPALIGVNGAVSWRVRPDDQFDVFVGGELHPKAQAVVDREGRITEVTPRCPSCGSDDLGMWAEDGESDDADFWECEDCKHGGPVTDDILTDEGVRA